MIYARMYPSKFNRPVIVMIERHVNREIKAVRCVESNRYPFHIWPIVGEWISSDCGFARKEWLFDLRSNRIVASHKSTVPVELSECAMVE